MLNIWKVFQSFQHRYIPRKVNFREVMSNILLVLISRSFFLSIGVTYVVSDSKNLSVQQKQRLIDVAKQCLDRLDILFKKLNGEY